MTQRERLCLGGVRVINFAILVSSDKGSRGERPDESGPAIEECLSTLSACLVRYEVVPDEMDGISSKLKGWADEGGIDLILTSGGTGLSPRDVTPEATLAIVDRVAPGIAEAMRAESLKRTPRAMLSRGVVGIRGRCLIINLPGSPRAVRESLEVILPVIPHAIEVLRGEAVECATTEA